MTPFRIDLLEGEWSVSRLDPSAAIPRWATSQVLVSITRTEHELSIVCPAGQVPDGVVSERGWAALTIRGPLDFSLTGVIAGLSGALADAGIPVFVVSTYDTDVVLVPAAFLDKAVEALSGRGYGVAEAG